VTEKSRSQGRLTIVPYRPEFAGAFRELNREWIERLFRLEAADEEVFGDPERTILAPGGQIFFACLDAEVVGTAAAVCHAPHSFELAKMAVMPAAQGRGIGRRLAEAVIAYARSAGAERLFLLTNRKLPAAIGLYEQLGFRHHELPPDTGYARADVYMELAL
jgi:GNAT superfamily N-acetyltransferase